MSSDTTATPSPVSAPKRRNAVASFFVRLVKEKPLGMASGIIIFLLILVALLGDQIAPYPYREMHLADRLLGPSAQYLLGTDQTGRDVLSRVIFGARISVLVGLTVTTLSVFISTLIGGISGFVGGKLDLIVQRFVDSWIAFPGLLLMLTIISIVGKGLLQIILILGISGGIAGRTRNQRRGYRHQREYLLRDGGGSWLIKMEIIHTTCLAQYHTDHSHFIQHQCRRGNHGFGFSGVPWIRFAARHS